MAIYQDTYYTLVFLFEDSAGVPTDITGWEFTAAFRQHTPDDDPPIFTLTDGDGIDVVDGPNGRLGMTISEARTILLPLGKVVTDFIRTDTGNNVRYFGATFKVKQPVTRL
jgi:hypothetical protein